MSLGVIFGSVIEIQMIDTPDYDSEISQMEEDLCKECRKPLDVEFLCASCHRCTNEECDERLDKYLQCPVCDYCQRCSGIYLLNENNECRFCDYCQGCGAKSIDCRGACLECIAESMEDD